MSAAAPSATSDLDELTLADLGARVQTHLAVATQGKLDGWVGLNAIIEELEAAEQSDLLVGGRRWRLGSVSVEGFRGALEPVKVSLNEENPLTVLFGENGAGKSTRVEALRVAIHGAVGKAHVDGTARGNRLWNSADEVHRDAQQALVTVELTDIVTGDRLTVHAVHTAEVVVRTGVLESTEGSRQLAADDLAWSAWSKTAESSLPIFSYAELASELNSETELHNWLTSCLSMDRSSSSVEHLITSRRQAANSALKSLQAAVDEVRKRIERVDADAGVAKSDESQISWGDLTADSDLAKWLIANGLDGSTSQSVLVRAAEIDRAKLCASDFLESAKSVAAEAAESYGAALDAGLLDLNKIVQASPPARTLSECPVCQGEEPAWHEHLHDFASKRASLDNAIRSQRLVVGRFKSDVLEVLERGATVLSKDPKHRALRDRGEALRAPCAEWFTKGNPTSPEALVAIGAVADWLGSPEGGEFAQTVLDSASEYAQWATQRRIAATALAPAFEAHARMAQQSDSLKSISQNFTVLLREIRTERSATLESLVSPALATLLSDVGIHLTELAINKDGSRLGLADADGATVSLSHLSAGQRNALILGPIIARIGSGTFSFTVVDDPVHAFDEFRVDHLARLLAEAASDTQLVVATHDNRFVQYLRIFGPVSSRFIHTSRVPPGSILLTEAHLPWQELADFAHTLISDVVGDVPPGVTRDIRALLRAGVDEAVEWLGSSAKHHAPAAEVGAFRRAFDNAATTAARWAVLLGAISKDPAADSLVATASEGMTKHLPVWDQATHGTGCEGVSIDELRAEVKALTAITKAIGELRALAYE